jgi:UDP-glucose 4-epimerase
MAVLPLGACQADPRLCLTVNIDGTFNVLEAARDAGVRKVVFSSASSVYGDTLETMDESHPLNASSMYGVSKIAGELLLRTFGASYGLRYVVLRYMNVYGPGQTAGVIAATINRIRQGLRPIIVGDGRQSFDFVYVADVARANVLAMESDAADEAFNVGSGEEVSVRDLVQQLIEICGADLQPEFKADERALMQRRVGSSARAREKLGYQATTPFRLGLERVVEAALGRTPGLAGDQVRTGR